MNDKLKGLLKSKRFIAAVLGVAAAAAAAYGLDVDANTIDTIANAIVALAA